MIASLSIQQAGIIIIMGLAFILLITERVGNDVVGVLIILALFGTGLLGAEDAFSGFGSEPAIVVASMLVLSGALYQTGLSDLISTRIGRLAGAGYGRMLAVIMPSVALLSAFTHHVTTTALMLPVTLSLSRERGVPASRLLMPMSFAASLGTTITIIGAPAFIVASGVLQQAGRPGLAIFSIAPLGLSLTLVGTLYMLTAGRFLLPARGCGEEGGLPSQLAQHFTELTVLPGSPLQARTVAEVETLHHQKLEVVGWIRNNQRVPDPYGERQLRTGDIMLVRTTSEDLLDMAEAMGVQVNRLAASRDQTAARGRAPLAGAIMLGTIVVATLSSVPLAIVTAGGAVAMVLSGCLTRRQAYRAIDPHIYVFIAGAMPLALAMKRTGVTDIVVGVLQHAVGGWSERAILLLLFAAAGVLTQFMSDAATTAVVAPVAAALAQALGRAPEPFVVTVAMASVAAFLTPIGHHGNLLVYGPGRYRFADFVRVGTPLTVLIALVVAMLAPLIW